MSELFRSAGLCFVATGNQGKLREIMPMLKEYLPQLNGVEGRAPRKARETEKTFSGNALIKARALHKELLKEGLLDFWVIADDSGLCVDALGGAPGVRSARYAGDHAKPEMHLLKLLRELEGVKEPAKRGAHYSCALALIREKPLDEALTGRASKTREIVAEGSCDGQIGFECRGEAGFGYDPLFFVPSHGKTMAELPYDVKNSFSHRRRAFEKLAEAVRAAKIS